MFNLFSDLRSISLLSERTAFGSVEDLYFDDHSWRVRYVVADVGGWFSGRKGMIGAHLCGIPDMVERVLPIAITRTQAEEAPSPDQNPPVSEQLDEQRLGEAMPAFMVAPANASMSPAAAHAQIAALTTPADRVTHREGDPRLRSAEEILGYAIRATDGEIGTVDDILVDPTTWNIVYLVLDTGGWLVSKRVIVAPTWTKIISWQNREVELEMSRADIEASPDIGSLHNISRDTLNRLHEHYGYAMV